MYFFLFSGLNEKKLYPTDLKHFFSIVIFYKKSLGFIVTILCKKSKVLSNG